VTEYLKQPAFWLAVAIVALVINWGYNYFTKKGKLI